MPRSPPCSPCSRWSSDGPAAHPPSPAGSKFQRRPRQSDHRHRSQDDEGRPYKFKDAETLIDDFFEEVERVLKAHGIATTVVAEETGEDDG